MKTLILGLILIVNSAHAASSTTTAIEPSASTLEFEATGRPSMMKIKGKGPGPQGKITLSDGKVEGTLKIPLSELKTGIELRDEHMKEKYLHVKDHPEAKLVLKPTELPKDWKPGMVVENKKFSGKLTLHGVDKDIEGQYSVDSAGVVLSKFDIVLSDFKIEIPSYLGVTVADKVKIQTQFKAEVK